jgi:uncharacterized protein YndB with AHSA1/START domain
VRERAWVSIENAVEIARPPEDVFDYLTDITKEFEWTLGPGAWRSSPRARSAPARGSMRSGSKGPDHRGVRPVRASDRLGIDRWFSTP